jgi:precorrin-3B C17-methyltransferase
MAGRITVVGIGPGSLNQMTPAARQAVEEADVIVGYWSYLDLISDLNPGAPRYGGGMRHEVKRAQKAIGLARAGRRVALVSGGDAGIYGMAGLVYEILWAGDCPEVEVEIVPGISALNAAAALLGAPLMTDFAAISLSDYLVPRENILYRLKSAAQADFVLCLYNPCSHSRVDFLEENCRVLANCRKPETPVGVVCNAYRPGLRVDIVPLSGLSAAPVDMRTILVVGNSRTTIENGKMITPRGYAGKYSLELNEQVGSDADETT